MSESVPETAQIVLKAGAALAEALEQNQEDDIEDAVQQLREAASAGQGAARLGFTATGPGELPPPLAVDSALIVAEVDVSLAHLFVNASRAVGETTSPAPPDTLRRAVESTGTTLDDLQSTAGKLGFAAEARIHISSSDLKQAQMTFRQEANDAADQVVDQSEAQVQKAFSAVAKQKDRIMEAWSQLDALSELGAPVASLLRYAWQRLSSALQTLKDIAAWITSEEAVDYLGDLIADASLRNCLRKIAGDARVRELLEKMRFKTSLKKAVIDAASEEVDALGRRFTTIAKRIMAIAAVATLVAPALTACFASPLAASFALPAVYALGVIAIVVMARDCLHEGHFNSGRGIGSILGELAEP